MLRWDDDEKIQYHAKQKNLAGLYGGNGAVIDFNIRLTLFKISQVPTVPWDRHLVEGN